MQSLSHAHAARGRTLRRTALLLGAFVAAILSSGLPGTSASLRAADDPASHELPAITAAGTTDDHPDPAHAGESHPDPAHSAEHDSAHASGHGESHGHNLGKLLPSWTVAPFALILLAIAIFPLTAPHWWEHNHNKAIIAAVLAVPVAIYLAAVWGGEGIHKLEHAAREYVSFIALLAALFIITGNILVKGSLDGTPLVNTLLLGFGALIASLIGTTGASVLLIRPLLRANASRVNKAHVVVFFIFTVSNCGGLLTPLGDPPLFLGFLNGVDFTWTLRLWPQWLTVNLLLLAIFNVYDQYVFAREEKARPGSQLEEVMQHEPLSVLGTHNFGFLLGVVAAIYMNGQGIGNGGKPWAFGLQELVLAGLAVASFLTTPAAIREGNKFTFTPINEVAILFAGIFVCMVPALAILNAAGPEMKGLQSPWQFFWLTGLLSSFLDNAPTYLTFAATASGIQGVSAEQPGYLGAFLESNGKLDAPAILAAISCGAVFMGANTYIGNGPNFMVKAIAEENGVKMPGFFGYMVYAIVILIPIFVVITLLFFRA